ncbi:alpha/beta hydrolase [Dactylosporangium sp. NPDC051485]|uniref:alpha/beta hydrolase n=1 Tax=Dactylosporangium sp. NPDC051485 TaxID=3154846 RepID=UPI0034323B8B
MSFADLHDLKTGPVRAAGDSWLDLSNNGARLMTEATADLLGPGHRSGWTGDAADAAFARLDKVDDEFELFGKQARMVSVTLHGAADRLDGLQRQLHDAIDSATGRGMRVRDDGTVEPRIVTSAEAAAMPENELDRRLQRDAREAGLVEQHLRDLVKQATDFDHALTQVLNRLVPLDPNAMTEGEWLDAQQDAAMVAALFGKDVSAVPAAGTNPADAKAWWDGLAPDDRALYLAAYPDRVGALDGLPANVRDDANRQKLRDDIVMMRNGQWPKDVPHGGRDPLDTANRLLNSLEESEYSANPDKRLYLLGLDNTGDGRAIIALGNPDTAAHTGVLVPGVNTELGDFSGQVSRLDRLQTAADAYNNGSTSMIWWLDYDAPEADLGSPSSWMTAVGSDRAVDAAGRLQNFDLGLSTSHNGGSTDLTVIGHSYGSTVVGNASSTGDGLHANNVIVLGSPGMDVESVGGLKIDKTHVYAGAATDDPISYIGDAHSLVGFLGVDVGHGTDPASAVFGGNVLNIDTSGHSGYWNQNSVSLASQGAIIAGRPDNASLYSRAS